MTLTDRARAAILKLVSLYPERRTALLPALKLAQADTGYLSRETMAEAADLVGVPHSAALELAEFYTMLHTEPIPPALVVVCGQLPCALRGAEELVRDLRTGLRAKIENGSVEIERTSECFGACHRAPMARVGDTYCENLDQERRRVLIQELAQACASRWTTSPSSSLIPDEPPRSA